MKAILEFNLPEESESHFDAINGWKYKHAIWSFDQKLRSMVKYEGMESISIDDCRDLLRDFMNENNVNFE